MYQLMYCCITIAPNVVLLNNNYLTKLLSHMVSDSQITGEAQLMVLAQVLSWSCRHDVGQGCCHLLDWGGSTFKTAISRRPQFSSWGVFVELLMTCSVTFPRLRDLREKLKSYNVLYNLALGVTFFTSSLLLLIMQVNPDTVWKKT